jgi:uncharacterized membrane protein
MEWQNVSWPKLLIVTGVFLIIAGLLAWALQGRLGWIGRLPGDIAIERENFRFYFPITTMLLLSLLVSALLRLIRWLWPQ